MGAAASTPYFSVVGTEVGKIIFYFDLKTDYPRSEFSSATATDICHATQNIMCPKKDLKIIGQDHLNNNLKSPFKKWFY